MRVFKATYKGRKGRARESAKWYVELRDANERIRRIPAFTSKAASEVCGRKLEQLVAYHHSSGGQADPALMVWLEGLPTRIRQKTPRPPAGPPASPSGQRKRRFSISPSWPFGPPGAYDNTRAYSFSSYRGPFYFRSSERVVQ